MSNPKPDLKPDTTELIKLRYGHVQTLVTLAIVGLITLGGIVCMVKKVEGGQAIVGGVLGYVTSWVMARKSIQRSGRS